MLNFNSMGMTSVEFANSYAVSGSETLAEYIRFKYRQGETVKAIAADISRRNYKVDTHMIDWQALVSAVVVRNPDKLNGSFEGVFLYREEFEELKKVRSEIARKFLYLALVVHKWNGHPSGWVRYEREDFFKFWNLQGLKSKEKEAIAQEAVKHGMELRVIGSKNPIICYHITFQRQDGEIVASFDKEEQIKQNWEHLKL